MIELCVSSWSLRVDIGRVFPLWQFPQIARERFGVSAVELCQIHFHSTEAPYVKAIKQNVAQAGSRVANITLDIGEICHPDEKRREADLLLVEQWIRLAAGLGSPYVRVDMGREARTADEVIAPLQRLATYAEGFGIGVLVENHGGLSSDADALIEIVKKTRARNVGVCPDFGNFTEEVRYSSLAKLMPYARHVHVKAFDFLDDGTHPYFDMGRCLSIVKESGYEGALSMEFAGKMDPYEGTAHALAVCRAYTGGN